MRAPPLKEVREAALRKAGVDPGEAAVAGEMAGKLGGPQISELRQKIVRGKMTQLDIDRVRQIAKDEGVILEALNKQTQLDVLMATQKIVTNAVKLMGYQMEVVERVRKVEGAESDAIVLDTANRAQDLVVKTLKVLSDLHHEGFISVQQNNIGAVVSSGGSVVVSSPELDALIADGVRCMDKGGPLQDSGPQIGKHRYVRSQLSTGEAPAGGDEAGGGEPPNRDSGAKKP